MKKIFQVIITLFILFYTYGCLPKKDIPYNIHSWDLPNGVIVEYFEMWNGEATFTANLFQRLRVSKKDEYDNEFNIGIGGSYSNLILFTFNDEILLIKGKYAGDKKDILVAALNLSNSTFMGTSTLLRKYDDLSSNEIKLKNIILTVKGTEIKER